MEEMIQQVGLDTSYLNRYGNELSGGQRQRVGIARALILTPEFVVCDEAVSALDYAVRNKILKLLIQLKQEKQLTYLFISHDLSAINQICNRVIVMYRGEIMEILPSLKQEILHPYTKALLAAALGFNQETEHKIVFCFGRKNFQSNRKGVHFIIAVFMPVINVKRNHHWFIIMISSISLRVI